MHNVYGDNNKLNVTTMYTDKTACDQFLWWDSSMKGGIPVRDRDTFKKIFFKQFQDMEEVEIYNKLACLQQEGTMDEYFSNLLVLTTCFEDVTEEGLLQIGIGGMKQSIQNEIKLLHVKDVEQARQKEKLIEEKHKSQSLSVYIPPYLRENGKKDKKSMP